MILTTSRDVTAASIQEHPSLAFQSFEKCVSLKGTTSVSCRPTSSLKTPLTPKSCFLRLQSPADMVPCQEGDLFHHGHRNIETLNKSSPHILPSPKQPTCRASHQLLTTHERDATRGRLEMNSMTTPKRPNDDHNNSPRLSKYSRHSSDSPLDPPLSLSPLLISVNSPDTPDVDKENELLPTIDGKVGDVKSISAQTMADIITGRLSVDADVTIVDCRYPYEYDGGHIRGAINLFTQAGVTERFFPTADFTPGRRQVIIFHCEFSSERGPKMLRHLRQHDRHINSHQYPRLSYPHIYLLDSGYSAFYPQQKTLCEPEGYTSMFHGDHKQDLRKFRVKSKSWPVPKTRRDQNTDVRKTLCF